MTYYNRELQLRKTLFNISKTKHTNYHIVIVDDQSDEPINIQSLDTKDRLTVIRTENKDWTNPVIAYNIGIHEALKHKPDIIILQNAENAHLGDIITHANNNVNESNYISYPCFSLTSQYNMSNYGYDFSTNGQSFSIPKKFDCAVNNSGELGWYNHKDHRPTGYDFCAAISTQNMIKLNGYDERYAYGVAYGDDDLRLRVGLLGLSIEIPSEPIVLHQYHYYGINEYLNYDLVAKNKTILESVNSFKAIHTHTPELCWQ